MTRAGPDRATRSRTRRATLRRLRRQHHRKEKTIVTEIPIPEAYVVKSCSATECGAPVIWALNTTTKKAAPLDAHPSDDGNCRLFRDAASPVYEVLGTPEQRASLAGQLHTNHFKTCPKREDFRRGRRKKAGQ